MTFNLQDEIKRAAEKYHIDADGLAHTYALRLQYLTEELGLVGADPNIPTDPHQRQVYAFRQALEIELSHQTHLFPAHYADAFYKGDPDALETWRQRILKLHEGTRHKIYNELSGKGSGWGSGNATLIELPRLRLEVRDDFTLYHPILESPQEIALYRKLYRDRTQALEGFHVVYDNDKSRSKDQADDMEHMLIKGRIIDNKLRKPWTRENKAYDFPSVTDPKERAEYDRKRFAAPDAAPDPADFTP